MVFISVIIPCYNVGQYLHECLESVLKQSYKNFEIILVYDDGNLHDLKLVNFLMTKFKKKKIIVNKKNIGVSKSRNKALKYCKGKYIAFIDADDLWKKNKLYEQTQFMEKNLASFSFTSYDVVNIKGKLIKKRHVFYDPSYDQLSKKNIIGLSTVMINKKILNHIKFPDLKTQEDFALWLNLLKKGIKLSHIPTALSSWRLTKNSLSSNNLQKILDAFKLYYFYQKKKLTLSVYSVLVLGYNKIFK